MYQWIAKRKVLPILISVVMSATIGCTTSINYSLKDVCLAKADIKRQAWKVAVAPFKDIRPMQERNPPYNNKSRYVTRDRLFVNGNVAGGISEAIVAHFNHVHLFHVAEMTDESAMVPSKDVINKVKNYGYDVLLTGILKHFKGAGHVTELDNTSVWLASIPVFLLITTPMQLAEKNKHESFVEIIDVQLTDTTSGRTIWSGSFSKQMEMEYAMVNPARATKDNLKEIVKEIVKEIELLDTR